MGLPLWLGTVPDYEVVDDQMHITVDDFVIAMPINVFLVGCAKGRAALEKWQSKRSADILPFRGYADTA